MLFFNTRRAREIEEFAVSLAKEIGERCAPADAFEADRMSLRLARAIDEACSRAVGFQRERKLGIYGRAKLGTEFKLQLKEIGYDLTLVESMTRQLLLKISI